MPDWKVHNERLERQRDRFTHLCVGGNGRLFHQLFQNVCTITEDTIKLLHLASPRQHKHEGMGW